VEALQLQSDRESYRIIALRRDRTELLLIAQENGLQFPSVEIPRWERVAGNLISAVKRTWGCEAVCSFTLEEVLQRKSFDGRSDQIMECWGDVEMRTGNSLWVPICSLSQHEFVDGREYAALVQFLTKCNSDEVDPTAPFAKCGWFHHLQSWIAEMIRPLGLRLNGSFRQFNASPSFSLIRFETSGPAIWFKAAGEPNRHEFGITLKLVELFPNFLPKIIATRADWNGWLCFEAEGSDLGETREISLWETTAAILARLQIESVSKVSDITVSGARDLSTARLLGLVHPFFNVMAQLMRSQTKVPPAILSQEELHRLEAGIQRCLALLRDLEIPDALGHLDLNPGNIITSPRGCAFLDWAEAYGGNPFFSFQYLLEHFRRAMAADSAAESRLTCAYAEQWQTMASRVAIDEGLRLSRLLAVFAYAAGTNVWRDQERLKDPTTAGHLRSLTRRMIREANQLSDRRSLCLC
jgi:hypothetical protein